MVDEWRPFFQAIKFPIDQILQWFAGFLGSAPPSVVILLIGLFASASMPNKTDGLFYGGGLEQLWKQAIAAGAVMAYSFVVAYLIAFVIKKTMGIRISTDEEEKGIDAKFHRDAAYELQPA